MAKGASRKGIDSAGGVITGGSSNVFVNNAAVVRLGDSVAGHGKDEHSGPVMSSGSGTVFVNGKPMCRAGDAASCGHPASGSSNVFVGG